MYDSFVTIAGGAGLIGINPGNENQLIFYLISELGKAVYIFADGILVVCGAGTDNHQKFITFAGENLTNLQIPFLFYLFTVFRHGVGTTNFLRCRQ